MINDQARNLRQKVHAPKNASPSKTIAIVSGKGGVGKSNIAINFTLELLNKNKKVLLFDLDVGMGNIDILLGTQAKYTLIDMIKERIPIEEVIEYGPYKLSYIAGGSGELSIFSMSDADQQYFLKQYEKLQNNFHYIVFDLGAGISEHSMFFTLASDECFVVTTKEPTAITDAYGIIKHIVNYDHKMPIYIIMNRVKNIRGGKQAMNRFQNVIKSFLKHDVRTLAILPDDKNVSKAVMRQQPVTILNKRSPVSRAIQQMTEQYLNDEIQDIEEPKTFIQRVRLLLRERRS